MGLLKKRDYIYMAYHFIFFGTAGHLTQKRDDHIKKRDFWSS
jgi:hypothetical protein